MVRPGRAPAAAPAPAPSSADRAIVAALGYDTRAGGIDANRRGLAALVEQAADFGAQYVATPELAVTGGTADACAPARRTAEPIPGPTTAFFGEIARRRSLWLSLSVLERDPSRACYVTAVLMGPDGAVHRIARKVLVRADGDGGAAPGPFRDAVDSVDAGGIRIGIVSADDMQAGVPRLAERGARLVLVNGDAASLGPPSSAGLGGLASQSRVAVGSAGPACRAPAACGSTIYGVAPVRHETPDGTVTIAAVPRIAPWTIASRTGLPGTVPVPSAEPGSAALAELGRQLFTDRGLSSTKTVACVTCHDPARAFTNNLPRGVGVYGRTTKRNVPSLLNVAFRPQLQWDGYASSIENFVKYPLSSRNEMDFHYLDQVVPYVRGRADYAQAFRDTMGVQAIEFEHVASALAAYQRTLLSGRSPFDRYVYGGDRTAMSESAVRGMRIFTGRGGCAQCHRIDARDALFTDGRYHALGVGYDAASGTYRDIGLAGISTNDFAGEFLTPSLRNVALTFPYMHDGSLPTLDAVIAFYQRGSTDPRVPRRAPIALDAVDRADLVAFLESLTGDQRYGPDGRALPAPAMPAAERDVRAVIDRFYAAAQRRDWDATGELMSPDFEISSDGAEVFARDAYVALMKTDDLVVERIALRNLTVRVSPDERMAWATFRGAFAMTSHGARHDVETAETLVLSRPADRWLIVRAHASVKSSAQE